MKVVNDVRVGRPAKPLQFGLQGALLVMCTTLASLSTHDSNHLVLLLGYFLRRRYLVDLLQDLVTQ